MIALTVEETLNLNRVATLAEPVELYSTEGIYVGLFVPAILEHAKRMQAAVAAQVDWAEVDRRADSNEGSTDLADVVARMKAWEESGLPIPEQLSSREAAALLNKPVASASHGPTRESV